jgi:glycerophosphoryl diester phosphodiesterase
MIEGQVDDAEAADAQHASSSNSPSRVPAAKALAVSDMLHRIELAALCLLLATPAAALDVQGHRGARGLAPENTLAGFAVAVAAGATTLELDVGLTRDGQVVVMHDRRLHPDLTRDPQGRWLEAPGPALTRLTLSELQAFDVGRIRPGSAYAQAWPGQRPADGQRVPTLDAVLAWARQHAPPSLAFNIETKLSPLAPDESAEPAALVNALLAVIDRHGLRARTTVQSFDWRTLRLVQQLAPGLRTSALTVQRPNFDNLADGRWTAGLALADHGGSVPRLVKALGATAWSPNFRDLTPEALSEAQALKLLVLPWTVNEPADIERLVAMGVDGLISDYPDRVVQALRARQAEKKAAPQGRP